MPKTIVGKTTQGY